MCREKTQDESSNLLLTPREYHDPSDEWWHDIPSLRRCATHSCKLCKLVLNRMDDRYLSKMELWQATLPVAIWAPEEELLEFRVYTAHVDPRPEAEVFNSLEADDYVYQLGIQIQNDSGKTYPLQLLVTADHAS